jgi:polygalacturonase
MKKANSIKAMKTIEINMKSNLILLAALLLAPLAVFPEVGIECPAPSEKSIDIRSYGALGDGISVNTSAIQKAIDACHAAGGGKVMVPKGVFLTGSLLLKSGVTLRVEKDAILRGSAKIADYAVETAELHWFDAQDRLNMFKSINTQHRPALIYAEDAERIGLEGSGVIDGQGGIASKIFPNKGDPQRRIPILIRFERCRDVRLSGLTLIDPAMFATFFACCTDIQIERITVRSRDSAAYGNAFVLAGSRRVSIKDCDADCKDDCIALQTFHPDWPNEDIEISGCRLTTNWCGIRIGCESFGATRRLSMRDCKFTDCQGGIKIESAGGQTHEDLSFSNIEMTKVCQPIMVLASRFAFSKHHQTRRPPIGHIRNVRFEHIKAIAGDGGIRRSKSGWEAPWKRPCTAVVSGPDGRIENITFSDIDITFPGGGTAEQAARLDVGELLEAFEYIKWAVPFDGELPASALYLRHVKGIHLENVRFTMEKPDARAFIAGDDIEGLTLHGVVGRSPASAPGLAKLADARSVTEKDCRVDCGGTVLPVMVKPTEIELNRLEVLRKNSVVLDREIQQKVDQADIDQKKVIKSK